MIRKLISKFNRTFTEKVVSVRKDFHVPIKIWLEPDRQTGKLQMPLENLSISGETKDLSVTGIAFIVSSIRLKEHYLVGEGKTLNAELDLPGGKIRMQIVGQRHEQFGKHISTAKFLVGAKITKMSDQDREAYEDFLRYGKKRMKKSLALGIDES
ncbi:MAG: PilZ domain-containing protein [Pyrinomonadaceae bacterium]|nr:PilZ domain-containing protein [Pyrinomonadaceae bacterium]